MKRITLTLLLSFTAVVSILAQNCGSNGPSACTPTGGPSAGGFQDLNTVPCVERAVAYNYAIQFKMFSDFNYQGQQVVDSIRFTNITNLPCGMCWSLDRASKMYAAGEPGCINISGTTYDVVGQYKLGMSLDAYINGVPQAIPVSANLSNQAGIKVVLRVKDTGSSNCPNADTTEAADATNKIATPANCAVGINSINGNIASLTLLPNPFSTQATVSFVAADAAEYTLRVTNLAGQVVSEQKLNAVPGTNTATINRNNLPAGAYFLMLSDGQNNITKRFSITE